jgi:hypothetical protein
MPEFIFSYFPIFFINLDYMRGSAKKNFCHCALLILQIDCPFDCNII